MHRLPGPPMAADQTAAPCSLFSAAFHAPSIPHFDAFGHSISWRIMEGRLPVPKQSHSGESHIYRIVHCACHGRSYQMHFRYPWEVLLKPWPWPYHMVSWSRGYRTGKWAPGSPPWMPVTTPAFIHEWH